MPPDTVPRKPKIQRLPPLPPPDTVYHRIRKRVHLICFVIFVILPFFNLMRFDIPRQRFYFAGFELWISEFAIIFFSLMFFMFLITASAIIHGRVYCGYACPQMIFSEWSVSVEKWAKKKAGSRWPFLFYGILGVASVFLAFVFTSYFVEPRDLLSRLMHLDIKTAAGITGATVTLFTFLDFTLVRQKFCTTVCPYGYLQGILQDKESLLVIYRDGAGEAKQCIECGKCVRVCEMEIDIRRSPNQIECVHCGDCIDACEDVLRRIGRPGLIHYAWGESDQLDRTVREPWYRRWGFRDAKRVAILAILGFYLCGLGIALSVRRPVLVQVAPDRTFMYRKLADGRYANMMRIKIANRSSKAAIVRLWTENLPGAEIALDRNPLSLAPAESLSQTVELRAPRWQGSNDVNRFRFLAQSDADSSPQVFEITFILPPPGKEK